MGNHKEVMSQTKLSFMHENDTAHKDVNSCKKESDEPKFPPGSHSEDPFKDTTERVQSLSNKLNDRCSNRGFSSQRSMNSHSQKSKVCRSILDLMDELVTVGQTMGYNMAGLGDKDKQRWIKELYQKHRINFSSIQETKVKSFSLHTIKDLWGNQMFDHEGDTVVMGDFNEVRSEHERFGSTFNRQGANAFNNFISSACLIDLPLEGYVFTWAHKSASKMSKLDRYLILEGVLDLFPHLSALCLDGHLSDHRPILLRETNYDYGPFSFRFFHSWFAMEGFNFFVKTTWKSLNIVEPNGLIWLKKKLQALKIAIKACQKKLTKGQMTGISTFNKISQKLIRLLIKESVDFEKAFDSVKWDNLDETLKAFGFGSKWRNWISSCLNNTMGSVLVNGSPTLEFQFHKGLKQVFIDEWSNNNIQTLLSVLRCFYLASDFKINLHKSKLMGICVSSNVVAVATSLIGCSILTAPFNYLGLKVGSNMSRITSWDDVISKVSLRLSKWKRKLLSIDGRLSLLKSVLTSIPLYHMSLFKVPIDVLNHLESIRQNFFYGVDGSDRKLAWIGWNMVLTSKKNGGLGVSSFFSHNHALLFKWVWRFLTDGSSLWSRFIKAIFGNKEALNTHKLIPRRSPWQDVILAIHSLQSKGEVALKVIYKRLYALDMCKSISVAEKMGHPSLSHSFRRMPRDRWYWSLEGSLEFSVKSSRILIDNPILPKAEVPTRWLRVVPIKVNVHAWRVCLDRLPTRANLSLRGMDIPSIACPLCNSAVESSCHIFFACPLARHVWRKILIWWELEDKSIALWEFSTMACSLIR
nr:RNA-directed DNA polymerase, eukaryota, reverse transcriptase zinc-binding domain protein [Tanacetum cinerariifolium]